MKKIPFLLPFFLALVVNLFAQENKRSAVYFATDQYQLTAEAKTQLDDLAEQINNMGDYQLVIEAHTDDRGTEDYNLDLAENRAAAVHDYLVKQGVLVEKTTVSSYGEENPAYSNAEESSRRFNRRVDLVLSGKHWQSLDEFMGQLRGETVQRYTIDANQGTRLIGEDGTTLWIDPNTFVLPDGSSPTGNIELVLQEAYGFDQMLMADLATQSGGKLLETGGMIYVGASLDGQPLDLQEGARITLAMPTAFQQEGMQLFTAAGTPQGGVNDWTPTGQNYRASLEEMLDLPPRPKYPNFYFNPPKYEPDESGKPIAPSPPKKPIMPREPDRESIKYNPGFFKRLVMGKKKVRAKEERMFATTMRTYNQRQQRYLEAMAEYQAAVDKHVEAKQQYKLDLEAWKQDQADAYALYQPGGDIFEEAMAKQKAEQDSKVKKYEEALEQWEALRQEKLEAFENSYAWVGNLSAPFLNNYFYEMTDLGWINCDRFLDTPEEQKQFLAINDPDEGQETVYVIFKDIDSVLRPSLQGGQYRTQAVPTNAEVTVLALKVEHGNALMAVQDTRVGAVAAVDLDFQPASLREVRLAMEQL